MAMTHAERHTLLIGALKAAGHDQAAKVAEAILPPTPDPAADTPDTADPNAKPELTVKQIEAMSPTEVIERQDEIEKFLRSQYRRGDPVGSHLRSQYVAPNPSVS